MKSTCRGIERIARRYGLGAVCAVAAIAWFGYQAYAIIGAGAPDGSAQNYSAYGAVSSISQDLKTVTLSGAVTSDGGSGDGLSFDLSAADDISSTDYTPLSLSDIKTGDTVVLQGLQTGETVSISRVIDYTWAAEPALAATSTASTTVDAVADASSTTMASLPAATTTIDVTATTTDGGATVTPDGAASTDQSATSTPAAEASSTPDTEATSTRSSPPGDASSTPPGDAPAQPDASTTSQ